MNLQARSVVLNQFPHHILFISIQMLNESKQIRDCIKYVFRSVINEMLRFLKIVSHQLFLVYQNPRPNPTKKKMFHFKCLTLFLKFTFSNCHTSHIHNIYNKRSHKNKRTYIRNIFYIYTQKDHANAHLGLLHRADWLAAVTSFLQSHALTSTTFAGPLPQFTGCHHRSIQ